MEAVTQVLASEGFESVPRLAEDVELPWAVGQGPGKVVM